MSPKHMTDVLSLVKKEEALEMEKKIAKSLHFKSCDKTQPPVTVKTSHETVTRENTEPLATKKIHEVEHQPLKKPCDVKANFLLSVDSRKLTQSEIKPFMMQESVGMRPRSGSQSASL